MEDHMEDEGTCCWICLMGQKEVATEGRAYKGSECRSGERLVSSACKCPRPVHPSCLARWQLHSAGKAEERSCRFCGQEYPDWRSILTPAELNPITPVMAVSVHGKVHKIKVHPGPQGKEQFKRQLQQLLGYDETEDFDVIFECKTPNTGERLHLQGFGAFEAAAHCAAVSAARRQQHRQQRAARKLQEQESRSSRAAGSGSSSGGDRDGSGSTGSGSSSSGGGATTQPAPAAAAAAAGASSSGAAGGSSGCSTRVLAQGQLVTSSSHGQPVFQQPRADPGEIQVAEEQQQQHQQGPASSSSSSHGRLGLCAAPFISGWPFLSGLHHPAAAASTAAAGTTGVGPLPPRVPAGSSSSTGLTPAGGPLGAPAAAAAPRAAVAWSPGAHVTGSHGSSAAAAAALCRESSSASGELQAAAAAASLSRSTSSASAAAAAAGACGSGVAASGAAASAQQQGNSSGMQPAAPSSSSSGSSSSNSLELLQEQQLGQGMQPATAGAAVVHPAAAFEPGSSPELHSYCGAAVDATRPRPAAAAAAAFGGGDAMCTEQAAAAAAAAAAAGTYGDGPQGQAGPTSCGEGGSSAPGCSPLGSGKAVAWVRRWWWPHKRHRG